MKDTIHNIRDRHGTIYRVLLFLCCIAVLVFLMPVDTKFQYEYSEGRIWKYDDLYAPFDFAIMKPEDSIRVEKERMREAVVPYYRLDETIQETQKADFENRLKSNWDDCSLSMAQQGSLLTINKKEKDSLEQRRHLKLANKLLEKVFDEGILELNDVHEDRPEDAEIYYLVGNKSKTKEIGEFHDLKSAFQYLEKKLKKEDEYDWEFLLQHAGNALKYNIFYDEEKTEAELAGQLESILNNIGKVANEEKIISRGELVSGDKWLKLESLRAEYQKQLGGSRDYYIILGGHIVLISLCLLSLYIFLRLFRKEVLRNTKTITFMMLLVSLMGLMAHIIGRFPEIDQFILPLCLLPIIIRAFLDAELALFVHIVTVMAVSFMMPDQFTFIFLHLIAGVVAVFSIVNLRKRSQFFVTVGLIFATYTLAWLGITIISLGTLDLEYERIAWLGGNAALTLFSFPLIFIFEKLFGFVSETSLMELSDSNSPLLRELTQQAPGTFQHTIQVANLAEEAVHAVGGDALLVRTGALYHDIGKMKNPMYFIENQKGVNPHDDLPPLESSKIIVDHVIDGIEMARKYKLPEQVIDFIRTHHGTTRTEYFYRTYLKEQGLESLEDDSMFRYPGPLPYSKETAILMMADSVEAASRSLKDYSVSSIEGLVNGIIDHQMSHDQFVNANITFKDITTIKRIFVRMLMTIYHVRIEYPK